VIDGAPEEPSVKIDARPQPQLNAVFRRPTAPRLRQTARSRS
jgi:hypothetical protein